MPDVVISFTIPDANVAEAQAAFTAELGLEGRQANAADFKAWMRDQTKAVIIRHREQAARATAISGVDRTDPTTD